MDVMIADPPGQPVQPARQAVIRASLQRGIDIGPVGFAFPIGLSECVLYVEQPYARRPGDDHGRQPDRRKRAVANEPTKCAEKNDEGEVGQQYALAAFTRGLAAEPEGQPEPDQELPCRADTQQDEGFL